MKTLIDTENLIYPDLEWDGDYLVEEKNEAYCDNVIICFDINARRTTTSEGDNFTSQRIYTHDVNYLEIDNLLFFDMDYEEIDVSDSDVKKVHQLLINNYRE